MFKVQRAKNDVWKGSIIIAKILYMLYSSKTPTLHPLYFKQPVTKKSTDTYLVQSCTHNLIVFKEFTLPSIIKLYEGNVLLFLIKILHARNDLHHRNGKFIEPFNRQIQLKWNINNRIPVKPYASTL